MIHVEGIVLTTPLNTPDEYIQFDVPTPQKCCEVRKALGFFDPIPIRSSCSEGCTGCGIPVNFQISLS